MTAPTTLLIASLLLTPANAQMLAPIAAGTGVLDDGLGPTCTPAAGYAHCRGLTVDPTQTGGTALSNFAVVTRNATGALTLGGARIQDANCSDVTFTADAAGTTQIPWEIESCTPSTGAVIAWVKLASISASIGTVFFVSYDNAAISTPQNTGAFAPANVWDSDYLIVQHLGGALAGGDSTANANTCTNHSATAATGDIGGAAALNGTSAWLECGNITGLTSMTFSLWVKTLSTSNSRPLTEGYFPGDGSTTGMIVQLQSSGAVMFGLGYNPFASTATSTTAVNDGSWHYIVGQMVAGEAFVSIDAGTPANNGSTTSLALASAMPLEIGTASSGAYDTFSGSLDEVRASRTARPASQITAEFHNQSLAGTFLSFGGER